MNLSLYLKKRGAKALLAKSLGISRATVNSWTTSHAKCRRPIPIKHCILIEAATSGLVTRKDLRPDDWRTTWPELDGNAKQLPLTMDCEASLELINLAKSLHSVGRIRAISDAVAFFDLPAAAKKRIFDEGLLITKERCAQYQQGLVADKESA